MTLPGNQTAPSFAGTTILVVDDSPAKRYVITHSLRRAGFVVSEADTGEAALELTHPLPSLVVLDVNLPGINGHEVCRLFKENARTCSVPILQVSATYTDTGSRVRGLNAGADGYLAGPVEPEELLATVRALLRARFAEEAARESHARLALAIEHARLGTFDGELPHGTWKVNEYFHLAYGNEATTGELTTASWEARIHPSDRGRVLEEMRLAIEGRKEFELEHRIAGSDTRWVVLRGKGVYGEEGSPLRVTGSAIDITVRKRTEILLADQAGQLARLAQKLSISNRDLESFASVASHDLKEPLRTVSTYLQLLRRAQGASLSADSLRYIDEAVRAAARMRNLIEALLNFASVRSEEELTGRVPMSEVFDEVRANLGTAIAECGARVGSEPLPRVVGNRGLLTQLLQNLVGNALKFHEQGKTPCIQVRSRPLANEEYEFSVSDNGIGFDAEYKDQIFQMFTRLHTHDAFSGSGLGLAVSQRIVEGHGGRIWAEGAPGEGATFFFTLPSWQDDVAVGEALEKRKPASVRP